MANSRCSFRTQYELALAAPEALLSCRIVAIIGTDGQCSLSGLRCSSTMIGA